MRRTSQLTEELGGTSECVVKGFGDRELSNDSCVLGIWVWCAEGGWGLRFRVVFPQTQGGKLPLFLADFAFAC